MVEIALLSKQLEPVFAKYGAQVLFAYVFGSAAEGSVGPLSDVDLAIYVKDPDGFSLNDKLLIHADCCRVLKRNDIDLVILNQTRNLMLLDQITRKGNLIWEKDSDARIIFELKIQHVGIDFQFQRQRELGV
jgi:hypothetical protein